jgi:hypothetical protein
MLWFKEYGDVFFFLPGEYGAVCYADAHTCHKEKRNLASEESAELDAL